MNEYQGKQHIQNRQKYIQKTCALHQRTLLNPCFTLASSKARVSSTAAFTFQLKRSPRIRMSGPVMWTTDGWSASALVSLITSPRPCAACSFTSGSPLSMASRKIGRIGVMPYSRNNTSTSHQQPIFRCVCKSNYMHQIQITNIFNNFQ